jgi:paraquat-inducible protein B
MRKTAGHALIGNFAHIALQLTGAALVMFGTGRIFEKISNIILYSDHSPKGFEASFSGARATSITSQKVDIYPNRHHKIFPVVLELSERHLRERGSTARPKVEFVNESGVKQTVTGGLGAKAKQQTTLTLLPHNELEIVPDTPRFTDQADDQQPYPTVPTRRPQICELTAGFPGGLENCNDFESKCAVTHLRNVLTTAKTQIAAINEDLVGIGSNIRSLSIHEKPANALDSADLALSRIDALIKHTFGKIITLMADLEEVMRQSETGLVKIDEATADIVKAMNPRAPALMRIQNALEEVERASRGAMEFGNGLEHFLLSAPPRKGSQLINIHLNLPNLMIVRCCGVFTPVKDPNFYHVMDRLVTDRHITHSPLSMAVNSPSFPHYLTLEQLVTRSGGKLVIRSVDLWAEPLDTGMTRVTASNYSQLTAPPKHAACGTPHHSGLRRAVGVENHPLRTGRLQHHDFSKNLDPSTGKESRKPGAILRH